MAFSHIIKELLLYVVLITFTFSFLQLQSNYSTIPLKKMQLLHFLLFFLVANVICPIIYLHVNTVFSFINLLVTFYVNTLFSLKKQKQTVCQS